MRMLLIVVGPLLLMVSVYVTGKPKIWVERHDGLGRKDMRHDIDFHAVVVVAVVGSQERRISTAADLVDIQPLLLVERLSGMFGGTKARKEKE